MNQYGPVYKLNSAIMLSLGEIMTDNNVRVRFAPSPTGKLHIGGARTAIFNWAFARANHGSFVLRIDDTDPIRSTKENERIITSALTWLGLDWDEGPGKGGAFGPYKQMERMDNYHAAIKKLLAEDKAYICFCTPEELEAAKKQAQTNKDSYQGYNRACRNLSETEVKTRIAQGEAYTVRIKVPLDHPDIVIDDLVHGKVTFAAKELDDFIILRSDGTPTYNFCTVVDDSDMKISHIIRGDDHLSNTPRQIIVYEALGASLPKFAHISMILGEDGKKLSKRHGATSVEEYESKGYAPDALLNYLALLGWAPDGETTIVSRDVLARTFSFAHVSKNPATFDSKKLDWINKHYLQTMSDADFAKHIVVPELAKAGYIEKDSYEKDPARYTLMAAITKPRVKVAPDVVNILSFLFSGTAPKIDDTTRTKALSGKEAEVSLLEAINIFRELDTWNTTSIDTAMHPLPKRIGVSNKVFFGAIRAAATGSLVSPPLAESLALLGQNLTLKRLDHGLNVARDT